MVTTATIGLVDDDPGIRQALECLLRAEGFAVRTFTSAEDFLKRGADEPVDCLVLDVVMPGRSGLDLQEHLQRSHARLPIVFLTGRGDIPMTVRAVKAGAVDFLTKPVEDAQLLHAVRRALAEAERQRSEDRTLAELRSRLDLLSPREREVLRHVIAGKPNKKIAAELGTSEQTIKPIFYSLKSSAVDDQ